MDHYRDLINQTEQLRQADQYDQLAEKITPALEELLKQPETDITVAQAVLGLARIAYVAGTSQLKAGKELNEPLERQVQGIYEGAKQNSNLPLTDINNTPIDWQLEILQDKAGRASITDPSSAINLLQEAINSHPPPSKPDTVFGPKSPEWQKYLGTMSALSVIYTKLGRQLNDIENMMKGLSAFLQIFSYPILQNTERLTALSLWTAEMAVKQAKLDALLLSVYGVAKAFFANPRETGRIISTAIKRKS